MPEIANYPTVVGPGPTNSLGDLGSLRVGHYHQSTDGYDTGTTAILFDRDTRCAVDVGGGGPGTRETDALSPSNLVEYIHGICLSGGSAYGLDAAGGVMEVLERNGVGYRVGDKEYEVVPIVPSAIIFDLGRGGDFRCRPDKSFGQRAAESAVSHHSSWGRVGAGRGARSGGGPGGIGSASVQLADGGVVGALAVCNSLGSIVPSAGELPFMWSLGLEEEFEPYREAFLNHRRSGPEKSPPPFNTTLVVVGTNLPLSRSQCQKLASVGHDGLARAVRPAHSYLDGDVVFALSIDREETPTTSLTASRREPSFDPIALSSLMEIGAEVIARAIIHGVGRAMVQDSNQTGSP